jgi:hypothetical protein
MIKIKSVHWEEGIVKVLVTTSDARQAKPMDFVSHSKPEARRVWELYKEGTLREIYFRADKPDAILVLECPDLESAREAVESLPLVREGLLEYELIGLKPYPGLERLFAGSAAADES